MISAHEYKAKIISLILLLSGIAFFTNATINPFLYSLLSKRFRRGFEDLREKICCKKNSNQQIVVPQYPSRIKNDQERASCPPFGNNSQNNPYMNPRHSLINFFNFESEETGINETNKLKTFKKIQSCKIRDFDP